MRNNNSSRPVKPGVLLAGLLLASSFILHLSSFAQAVPALSVAPDPGLDWTQIIAAIGAVIILARLIVKLTPTPQDDSFLEKVVEFLKHVGLNLKVVLLLVTLSPLLLFSAGCGTPHPTTVTAGSTNGNVAASVTSEITTNLSVGVTGTYDPTSSNWTAGIVVVFKETPSAAVLQLAQNAGAVAVASAKATGSSLKYVLTRPDLTSAAQTNFIEAARANGASINRILLAVQ